MVITDYETGYTSREATGRFQVALAQRSARSSTTQYTLPIQVELQCVRDRIQAHINSRQIDLKYRQN